MEISDQSIATSSLGWFPVLALHASIALLALALSGNAAHEGSSWAYLGYWFGLAALSAPIVFRLVSADASRTERIATLILFTGTIHLTRLLASPLGFAQFDEFLHWVTVEDIIARGALFTPNPLLPVSSLYPGLEIATASLSSMSGLDIFESAVVLVGVARALTITAMFLLFERITNSARVASTAALVYAGHSNFTVFHSQFAYETLACAFLAIILLSLSWLENSTTRRGALLAIAIPSILALTVTHHVTSFITVALLFVFAVFEIIKRNPARLRATALALALIVSGAGASALWAEVVGAPIIVYFGPLFDDAGQGLYGYLTGSSRGRKLFVSEAGTQLPIVLRLLGIVSVLIICLALARGFIRSLSQSGAYAPRASPSAMRKSSLGILLTLLTLLFPVTLILRLSQDGWEIGNRMGSFVFIGVGLVVAIALISRRSDLQNETLSRNYAVAAAVTAIILGGVVAGAAQQIVPTPYAVSADARSVEPLGIDAALWTRSWLGKRNRFASDRINRLLLATYGAQRVTTSLYDGVDTSWLVFGPALSENELKAVRDADIDFVLADLRLSTALPGVGVYFETGESAELHKIAPAPSAMLKFNSVKGVHRLYDNGSIVIFDVRTLRASQ